MTENTETPEFELYTAIQREKQIKKELKELADIIATLRDQIRKKGTIDPGWELVKKNPSMKANPAYFAEHYIDYYKGHAHVTHAQFATKMAEICGGMDVAQMRLRDAAPEWFDKTATITISDVKAEFGENALDRLIAAGGITLEEDKEFTIKRAVNIHPETITA